MSAEAISSSPMVVLDARTASARYPGIGRYTFELARALARIVELTLIVNPLQASSELDVWSIPARRVAAPHAPRSLAQQWVIPARLHRLRARLYHSPYYLMPYVPGVPAVMTAHDVIPLSVSAGFSAAQRLAYWAAHLLAFCVVQRVITPSHAARADFAARFRLPAEKIVAIPHGLPAGFTPPAKEALEAFRDEHRLPDRYLLYVGSRKPHKNLPALIHALADLPASAPPLIITGPEDVRDRDVSAAAGLGGRVRFLGWLPEAQLPLLYAGATLYVQPSLLEGFGFPVLEAMGCGTPVVCSDLPVLRELADHAALYFDPRRPQAIAHTLAEALDSPGLRRALSERGLLRARAFTWERAAAATVGVYAQVIGRP